MEGEVSGAKSTSMEQTSLLGGLSTKKQYIICCKPTYRMRKLRDKGAIIVLIWNFLVASVINFLVESIVPKGLEITVVALGLTLPFAGWLADIRFGRYKVIRCSIWIMWIVSMLITINAVVAQFVTDHYNIEKRISQTMIFILAIGFGGYQANAIQFGLDQLQDASTTEITAFICWYVWTYFCNATFMELTRICIKPKLYVFGHLLVSVSITAVISSSFLLESSLVKEPVTQNPFKLIYKVIQYAIKTKYPIRRSAFTYCEDELPSRIDFGKSKYGGPFTTEQVEDVKTFLRLLVIITTGSVLAGKIIATNVLSNQVIKRLQHTKLMLSFNHCYIEIFSTMTLGYAAIAIFIPLYEFIIYPVIQKCLPSIKIYQKFLLGMTLQVVKVIIIMAYDLTARKNAFEDQMKNITIKYNKVTLDAPSLSFNKDWVAITTFIECISRFTLSISSVEFFASQTPYSMRGLMIGAGYGSIFLFTMIAYGIYWPFTQQSSTWGTGIISCEFWYLLSVLVVLIIVSGILLAVGRWYKNRKRQDVLPNEHIFAERFYTALIDT